MGNNGILPRVGGSVRIVLNKEGGRRYKGNRGKNERERENVRGEGNQSQKLYSTWQLTPIIGCFGADSSDNLQLSNGKKGRVSGPALRLRT